jgi:acetyl-CoA C-acetyltransferase
MSIAAHRDAVASLWARMSEVAAQNPQAWSREVVSAARVRDASVQNRMLAFPYTKLHNSQWNVDQAAALVMTSAATARAHGIPESRWIFPLAAAESNHMVSLSQRRPFHRSPGFAHAGRAALARAGIASADVARRELYSCFPVAVRLQCRELGIPEDAALTVLAAWLAGGPLNNFVLQALVHACCYGSAERDRHINAVSGFRSRASRSGRALPERPFGFDDVSEAVARAEQIASPKRAATPASRTPCSSGRPPARTLFVSTCDGSALPPARTQRSPSATTRSRGARLRSMAQPSM